LIPNNKWTLTRKSVAAINVQYRNRLLYGADWRADVITAIQMGATRPATIVKWIGISYEPAHRIFEDLKDAGLVEDEKTKNRIPA
jgi:predicted transcriptional regulator